MPIILRGNIHAPVTMIAEKAADLIHDARRLPSWGCSPQAPSRSVDVHQTPVSGSSNSTVGGV
jgi:hypothetical protein